MDEAQHQLRALLRANSSIVGELSLELVLQRIVAAACELVNADYGALGVIAPDRRGLEQFVHHGMDPSTVERIGLLPAGKGLLGALIDEPHPIRLHRIADDPRSVGFPANHPPMAGFLGVPIRVRGEIFGNLYLSCRLPRDFTEDEEQGATALAATAGVAIENARLFEESTRRQAWLEAASDLTRELVTQGSGDTMMVIAETVHRLAAAERVAVLVPARHDESVRLAAAVGDEPAAWSQAADAALAQSVLTTGDAVRLDEGVFLTAEGSLATVEDLGAAPLSPEMLGVMALPLVGSDRARGAVVCTRGPGGRVFSEADLEMASTFAGQVSLALEVAEYRRDQQRIVLLEERARIARDLHDHVIQQLFAAGMTVQAVTSTLGPRSEADMLEKVVDIIDEAIGQIRSSIFQLRPHATSSGGLRVSVLEVAAEVRPILGSQPRVRFEGPVDAVSDAELVLDVRAVVREALTNVARHARATSAQVVVSADAGFLAVRVADDGSGLSDGPRRSGLANLERRAALREGSLTLSPGQGGSGTTVSWRVPLPNL